MIRSDDYKRRMEDPTRCIQVIPEQKKGSKVRTVQSRTSLKNYHLSKGGS